MGRGGKGGCREYDDLRIRRFRQYIFGKSFAKKCINMKEITPKGGYPALHRPMQTNMRYTTGADPGFLVGGGADPRGAPTYDFVKNFPKTA